MNRLYRDPRTGWITVVDDEGVEANVVEPTETVEAIDVEPDESDAPAD